MTQLHISNELFPNNAGWKTPSTVDLTGVNFCYCVGRMADGTTNSWPTSPTKEWAEKLLWPVPKTSTSLVMVDYEGQYLADLYSNTNKVKREYAIDVLRSQTNVMRQVRTSAYIGNYATPSASHKWPIEKYVADGYSFGRIAEFLNRQRVIYPLLYLLGDAPGQEFHARCVMTAAMEAAKEYGCRVAPVVSPRIWNYMGGAGRPDYDLYNSFDVFTPWIKEICSFKPSDLVLWHADPYFETQKITGGVSRALTEKEQSIVNDTVTNNLNTTLNICRDAIKAAV